MLRKSWLNLYSIIVFTKSLYDLLLWVILALTSCNRCCIVRILRWSLCKTWFLKWVILFININTNDFSINERWCLVLQLEFTFSSHCWRHQLTKVGPLFFDMFLFLLDLILFQLFNQLSFFGFSLGFIHSFENPRRSLCFILFNDGVNSSVKPIVYFCHLTLFDDSVFYVFDPAYLLAKKDACHVLHIKFSEFRFSNLVGIYHVNVVIVIFDEKKKFLEKAIVLEERVIQFAYGYFNQLHQLHLHSLRIYRLAV